jgi:hypothetical protein
MVFDKQPDVFIPVGTPGIDHAGHAYRLDNVVAIRLKKLRESGLPSTADVSIRAILPLPPPICVCISIAPDITTLPFKSYSLSIFTSLAGGLIKRPS